MNEGMNALPREELGVDDTSIESRPAKAGTPDPVGEEVINILDEVEKQFHRLRSSQSDQMEQLEALVEQSMSLDRQQQQLNEQLGSVEEQRQRLAEAQARLRDQQHQADERETGVDARLEQLRSMTRDLGEATAPVPPAASVQVDELDVLHQHMDQLRSVVDLRGRELERSEERRRQLKAKVAKLKDDLKEARQKSSSDAGQSQELVAQLHLQQGDLTNRNEQLEAERCLLIDQSRRLQQEIDSLRTELDTVRINNAQKTSEFRERLDVAEAELSRRQHMIDEQSVQLNAQESSLAERPAEIMSLEAQLARAHEELKEGNAKLARFSQLLKEQEPRLAEGTTAIARAQQQAAEIERLTGKLAEARVGGDVEELKRKDQRIKELTEALHQARGQTGAAIQVDMLEQQNATLKAENDDLRVRLEKASLAEQAAKERLENQMDEFGALKHADERASVQFEVEREALERRISTLERELEQNHRQMEASERLLEEARVEIAQQAERPELVLDVPAGVEVNDAHLARRRRRLAAVRRGLRKRATSGVAPASDTPSHFMQPSAMKQEVSPIGTTSGEELRSLREERRQLAELKQTLSRNEDRMMRRWARPRALAATVWFLVLISLAGGASWLAADMLYPPRAAAMLTVAAATEGGGAVAPADVSVWQRQQGKAIRAGDFHAALAQRLAETPYQGYSTSADVTRRLGEDLQVDFGQAGRMTLRYTAATGAEAVTVLDTLASALSDFTEGKDAQLADVNTVIQAQARKEGGVTRYASVMPEPLDDMRTYKAFQIFAVVLPVCLLVVAFCYRRLLSARRVFDEDVTGLGAAT